MKLTNRQINRLNSLAKKNLFVLEGDDRRFTLEKIVFLKKYKDADEDCWVVYVQEMKDWYFLENCKFFVLTPYPK